MLALLLGITMVLLLFVGVAALLLLVEQRQRGQRARVAQQIAVTDAIHRELGAVVAPTMTKRLWGPPRLVIPAPLESPHVVAAVLAIAHRALRGWDEVAAQRLQIVVVPQREAGTTVARRAA